MKKILLVITIMISFIFTGCVESTEVQTVKQGYLNQYQNVTLGDALDNFIGNPRWESITAEDGKKYVNVKGNVEFNNKTVEVLLQYKLNSDDSFELQAFEMNGIPQNMFMYSGFIKKVYESY